MAPALVIEESVLMDSTDMIERALNDLRVKLKVNETLSYVS
jgi:hypothetical protein